MLNKLYKMLSSAASNYGKISIPISFVALLLYLPIVINPEIFLERGNDLEEFFWPIYYFVKNEILTRGELPLWFPHILSGTPLLPDPQAPLFYLPNIIFLFLPINLGFIVSSFLHTVLGGFGMYLAAKKGFNFSKNASFASAFLYITSSRLVAAIEAGHFGLIMAWAWIPFVILSMLKAKDKFEFRWSLLLGVSMAGLFYTHTVTFLITAFASLFTILVLLVFFRSKKLSLMKTYTLGALFSFGLVAIALLPQLEWRNLTNRILLNDKPQIFPIWESKLEFLRNVILPWTNTEGVSAINTEKWIALGFIPSILAFLGFLKLKRKLKIILILGVVALLLFAFGNTSPLYNFLLSQDWYANIRVPTRVWFIPVIIISFLVGFAYQNLEKNKKVSKNLIHAIYFLAVAELIILSWAFILKPIDKRARASDELINYVKSEDQRYRVFCIDRCISQKQAVINDLELIEGYSTLIQLKYMKQTWEFTGAYWDHYSLSIPPIGTYSHQELQPDAKSLGDYNTKYVISPHELTDENFTLEEQFGKYLIYSNSLFKPRSDGKIAYYSPNKVMIDTTETEDKNLVLAEVYSPGWNAYLNGEEKVNVMETPTAQRAINLKPDTKFVELRYEPKSFKYGEIITLTTIVTILIILIKKKKHLVSNHDFL